MATFSWISNAELVVVVSDSIHDRIAFSAAATYFFGSCLISSLISIKPALMPLDRACLLAGPGLLSGFPVLALAGGLGEGCVRLDAGVLGAGAGAGGLGSLGIVPVAFSG